MLTALYNRVRHGNRLGIPQEFLAKVREPLKYTPDLAELEPHKRHLLFVCDDMMDGHRGHSLMGERKPLYRDVYTSQSMVMVMVAEGKRRYPVAMTPPDRILTGPFASRTPRAVIKGEMYAVSTKELCELDIAMENGLKYTRKRTTTEIVHYSVTEHETGTGIETWVSESLVHEKRAFMYQGNFEYWNLQKLPAQNHRLLKQREHNQVYRTNYQFTRNDWK